MRLTAALLIYAAANGQDKPIPTLPQITIEQRARFWRAQAEVIAAQARADKAIAAFQVVQAELVKACGEQQLTAGLDGEPACAPKSPESNTKAKKP